MDLKEIWWEGMDWIYVILDRVQWRLLLNRTLTHGVNSYITFHCHTDTLLKI